MLMIGRDRHLAYAAPLTIYGSLHDEGQRVHILLSLGLVEKTKSVSEPGYEIRTHDIFLPKRVRFPLRQFPLLVM